MTTCCAVSAARELKERMMAEAEEDGHCIECGMLIDDPEIDEVLCIDCRDDY